MMTNKETLVRLYNSYSKRYINKIIASILLSMIVAAATSAIAWLLDPAIEKIFLEKDQKLMLIIPLAIVLAFSAKGISLYLAKVIMIGVAEDIKKNIQKDMITSLVKADTAIIDNKHTGKFISNLTYDTTLIVNLVSTALLNLFKDSITLIGLLIVMFYQNWQLSLIAIIMIPLASLAAKTLGKRISKVTTEAQVKAGELNKHLMEIFKNHKLIKIFQKENFEVDRTDTFLTSLKEKAKKINIVFTRASPIMEVLTGIMIALLIYYSGKLILKDELAINNFFSFLAAMMLAYQPVRSLTTLNLSVSTGLSAAKRIIPIIDTKNEIIESETRKKLDIKKCDIKFENCDFKYGASENPVLNNLNLNIAGGKMTALVGYTGAGKSSIINLIPRFYDCQKGDIKIDNQSIYDVSIFDLRKNISIVTQDITLFDDTVKNNILYANQNATDEEVALVAKNSFAEDFINKLPQKYNTIIGENGVRLSGGEKQRISIARAMLKKTPIILLDEATSSLDAETENKIQNAMEILTENKTTVVIAHRLSTILNAHKIFVVDKGNIVADGTHKELIENSII
ncbi:ABC transporter transmembrane domain-containing protein, partial [Candidatus Pelagibacter sp.]|nr:ABC transporter transmembrane domain-containing protein [Candidatus Pelagibacter sp.]